MKKGNFILALLLVFPLLTGCIKDDFKDCLYITFDAINPKHIYTDEVQRVSIYFYGLEDNELVREYHFERNQLRRRDQAAIIPDAPVGTYRVLAIVNDGIYTVTGDYENYVESYTEVILDELSYNAESLFSAAKEITVEADPENVQVENMHLVKHNNNIIVHLEYAEEDPYLPLEGTNLSLWIDGSNHRHHYREQYQLYTYNGDTKLTSNPWERIDNRDNQTEAHRLPDHPARFSLTTMRLWHGSDVTLHLREIFQPSTRVEPGQLRDVDIDVDEYLKMIIIDEITKELKYGSDLDLEYHDEYHITIRLDNNGVEVPDPVYTKLPPLIVKKWNYIHADIVRSFLKIGYDFTFIASYEPRK
jgi:hypothetical protein